MIVAARAVVARAPVEIAVVLRAGSGPVDKGRAGQGEIVAVGRVGRAPVAHALRVDHVRRVGVVLI